MVRCWHCKAESPEEHYNRVVFGHQDLTAQWIGWRMRGRWLIAPNKAGRITPDRIEAILWTDTRARRQRSKSGLTNVVPLRFTRET